MHPSFRSYHNTYKWQNKYESCCVNLLLILVYYLKLFQSTQNSGFISLHRKSRVWKRKKLLMNSVFSPENLVLRKRLSLQQRLWHGSRVSRKEVCKSRFRNPVIFTISFNDPKACAESEVEMLKVITLESQFNECPICESIISVIFSIAQFIIFIVHLPMLYSSGMNYIL